MKKIHLFTLILGLVAPLAWADSVKVFTATRPDPTKTPVEGKGDYKVDVTVPTDEEMGLVKKMLGEQVEGIHQFEVPVLFGVTKDKFIVIEKIKKDEEKKPKKGDKPQVEAVKATSEEAEKLQNKLNGVIGALRNWELQLGLGGSFALSPSLYQNYETAFNAEFALGYKLFPELSLMLDTDLNSFRSYNDAATGGYEFREVDLGLLLKLRLANGPVRPYLLAGPALAINSYSLDFSVGNLTGNTTLRNAAFLAVAGLGFEIQIEKWFYLYVQGKLATDLVSSDFNRFITLDNPTSFMPVQVGIFFGR